ncbi:sulfotransferase [Ruficoccus amylovorans]|uniref:Sulfotransferase n=1 Tax=Ruficoccus amylovorans TaxID=1804625 RepID=A0A842HB42_9BACT|nr:sulfotransferase [Ruficoccus amylovorans]MBC2592936.1 sulfotransferase [Ruficoccus amylovorans]
MHLADLPVEDSPSLLDEHGPVFILGCPRSGTTFLSSCVAAIPGVREFVGVLAPPRMMHLIGSGVSTPIREELLSCVRDIFWQAFWRRVYFRGEKLSLLVERSIGTREFLEKPDMDGKIFCYKEPFLCFAAEHFATHFPKSKFIHIIRDGRDNADSMVRTYGEALSDDVLASDQLSYNKVSEIGTWRRIDGFNFPWWLPEAEETAFRQMSKYGRYVRLWKEMTLRCRALGKTLPPERYYEVKYDEFVKEPVAQGNRIREFLGHPDSAQFQKRLNKAFTKSTGISGRNQPPEQLAEALAIAGDLLAELGYCEPDGQVGA